MKVLVLAALAAMLCACVGPRGDQGDVGSAGSQGAPGLQGSPGEAGATGPAGADGTVITPVQFCLGSVSYPTTFPESGLCINGDIYAVYSANDGFLTKLAPGVYNSNAIGSACTFTVLPNCEIQ